MTSKRDIAVANATGFSSRVVRALLFVRLDFLGGVERYHTEIGPKTATHPIYGAEVYTGLGDFGGLSSAVKESIDSAPAGLSVSLTGIRSSLITSTLTDDYFRRSAEVMIGLEDETGTLLANPEILFSGYMDKVDIALGKRTGQMTMNLESRGTNLLRSSDWRFTDEDKQIEVSGDLFAEYIYRMADLQLVWGGKNPTQGSGGGGGVDPNRPPIRLR